MTICSIDSMSLFIPLSEIKIVESKLHRIFENDELFRVTTDGNNDVVDYEEIENPRAGASYTYTHLNDGGEELYTTHYKYINQVSFGSDGSDRIEGFAISVHSKLLHELYLEGLHDLTLDTAYDRIISQGVLEFSNEAFWAALVSDVDLKVDYHCDDFSAYTKTVLKNVNSSFSAVAKCMKTNRRITGMQIFRRGHRANPYFKLYNKKAELEVKSKAFFLEFLSGVDVPDARVEITYANTATARKYRLYDSQTKRHLQEVVRRVAVHGLSSMSRIQQEYIAMVMFGGENVSNPENIQGVEPPLAVMKKVEKFLVSTCFRSKGLPLAHALDVVTIFTRKDNHRYLRNYVITKYSEHKMDASLLELRR